MRCCLKKFPFIFENGIAIVRALEYNIYKYKHSDSGDYYGIYICKRSADKWGISQRRVAVLCSEKRIEEATMIGNMWIIPTSAEKPIDARTIKAKEKQLNLS